jgi:hypothetical protein
VCIHTAVIRCRMPSTTPHSDGWWCRRLSAALPHAPFCQGAGDGRRPRSDLAPLLPHTGPRPRTVMLCHVAGLASCCPLAYIPAPARWHQPEPIQRLDDSAAAFCCRLQTRRKSRHLSTFRGRAVGGLWCAGTGRCPKGSAAGFRPDPAGRRRCTHTLVPRSSQLVLVS